MVVKQLVCAKEEVRWLLMRLWRLRVSFQCLRAALGGSSILGFPHAAGGICECHWVCWETSTIAAESLTRLLSPGNGILIFHPWSCCPKAERREIVYALWNMSATLKGGSGNERIQVFSMIPLDCFCSCFARLYFFEQLPHSQLFVTQLDLHWSATTLQPLILNRMTSVIQCNASVLLGNHRSWNSRGCHLTRTTHPNTVDPLIATTVNSRKTERCWLDPQIH